MEASLFIIDFRTNTASFHPESIIKFTADNPEQLYPVSIHQAYTTATVTLQYLFLLKKDISLLFKSLV